MHIQYIRKMFPAYYLPIHLLATCICIFSIANSVILQNLNKMDLQNANAYKKPHLSSLCRIPK